MINAPAGSGKTTRIKSMIRDFVAEKPKDNILCITYTNRAAEELLLGIQNSHIDISTIHSVLHDFLQSYFTHKDILDYLGNRYSRELKMLNNQNILPKATTVIKKSMRNYHMIQFKKIYVGYSIMNLHLVLFIMVDYRTMT